jgi:hypothetical protein
MTDSDPLFVAVLMFRSNAPESQRIRLRRRLIRAPSLDAAREQASGLGMEEVPPSDGSGAPWIFVGVHAITEFGPWRGEGLDELERHLKTQLAGHPLSGL